MSDQERLELAKLELVHPATTDAPVADPDELKALLQGLKEQGRDMSQPNGEYFLG